MRHNIFEHKKKEFMIFSLQDIKNLSLNGKNALLIKGVTQETSLEKSIDMQISVILLLCYIMFYHRKIPNHNNISILRILCSKHTSRIIIMMMDLERIRWVARRCWNYSCIAVAVKENRFLRQFSLRHSHKNWLNAFSPWL